MWSGTNHKQKFEHGSECIIVEIIRVTEKRGYRLSWRKNSTPISFPTTGISVPGTLRKYRIIATSHHHGSLSYGHWTTKLVMSNTKWYECNDLKKHNSFTQAPGTADSSVVMLLMIAES